MSNNSLPRDHQLSFAVAAVRLLRAGCDAEPQYCTTQYLGDYHATVKQLQDALRAMSANGAPDPADLKMMMTDTWNALMLDPRYQDLGEAVNLFDLEDAAENASTPQHDHSEYRPILTLMSTVQSKPIRWLWYPYIALGKVCMVDGDPGLGKSLLTLQLAARLSVGDPLPDQQGVPTVRYGGPQKTLILCQEDGLEDTIKPRLEAAGADCQNIIHMRGWLDKDGGEHYFDLQHLLALEEAVKRHRPALVILDPIQSYFGKVNINQSNETRPLLDRLTTLAVRYQCAIVLIRHPSKPGQAIGKVIHRGLGSVDLIGAARTGLFVEQHPSDPGKVLLGQSKSNIGPLGRTQMFTKYEGKFLWCGVSRLTAEMIGGSGRGPEPYAFLEAVCWLEGRLTPEIPEKSDVLEKEADAEGISHKVLVRAKKALGVRSTQTTTGWLSTLPAFTEIQIPPHTIGSTGITGSTGSTGSTGYSDRKSMTYERSTPDTPLTPIDPIDPEYPVDPIVSGGSTSPIALVDLSLHAHVVKDAPKPPEPLERPLTPLTHPIECVKGVKPKLSAGLPPNLNHPNGYHRERGDSIDEHCADCGSSHVEVMNGHAVCLQCLMRPQA